MTDKSESTSVSDDAKVLPKRQGSGWIKDPHDTFFGTVFSIPSCAYSFVRDQLPDKIVELLADKEPRIIESSFFGDDLSKSKADLLMEVETYIAQVSSSVSGKLTDFLMRPLSHEFFCALALSAAKKAPRLGRNEPCSHAVATSRSCFLERRTDLSCRFC